MWTFPVRRDARSKYCSARHDVCGKIAKIKGMIVTTVMKTTSAELHTQQFDIPVIMDASSVGNARRETGRAGVRDRTELRTVRPRDLVRIGTGF